MLKSVAVVVAVAAVAHVPSALACVDLPPDLSTVAYPFAGQTVPTNAVLQTASFTNEIDGNTVQLTRPDGSTQTGRFVHDGSGARLEIDGATDGLAVGHWQSIDDPQRDDSVRLFAFDVADVIDDVAPAAPVVQVQRDDSGLGCGSGGSSLLLNFDDSVAIDDVALWRVQPGDLRIALNVDGLAVSEKLAELPKQVTVTAIDLAGNESPPTTVDVQDAGCASVPAASMSALAVLLLLVRRRRP